MKRKWSKQIFIVFLSATILFTCCTANITPATEPSSQSDDINNWEHISLTPGSDSSQLNFAWYAKKTASSRENFSPRFYIWEGKFMGNKEIYTAERKELTDISDKNGNLYYSNKVTVKNLKPNTTYHYMYEKENGKFTAPAVCNTKSGDSFQFIFVGDPQIGGSNTVSADDSEEFSQAQAAAAQTDAIQWNATLHAAMQQSQNQVAFVISAGDQINTQRKKSAKNNAAISEPEYAGYLSPYILKSLPVATTIGNHDADNPNYSYHFNVPNESPLGSNDIAGGDYYFTYGSALFIMLNTQGADNREHGTFIAEAIAAHPECKWRIVTIHQDIYGAARHSVQEKLLNLRYALVPYFNQYDIDVVFSGHDHLYSRSKMLIGNEEGERSEIIEETTADNDSVQNPKGILYITGGSSSGSKHYEVLPDTPDYIASVWEGNAPTYSLVTITEDRFSIATYRADTNEKIDKTFTITKTKS